MYRLKYFWIQFQFRRDIRSQSLKNSTLQCAWHREVKVLGFANQRFVLKSLLSCKMCSPLKGFIPTIPWKATRDQRNFLFWLRSVQIDSAVWWTQWNLTQRYDAQRGAWFKGVMHTVEFFEKALDSPVWCIPQSLTPRWEAHSGACVCYIFQLHFTKNVWSKKDSLNKTALFSH